MSVVVQPEQLGDMNSFILWVGNGAVSCCVVGEECSSSVIRHIPCLHSVSADSPARHDSAWLSVVEGRLIPDS